MLTPQEHVVRYEVEPGNEMQIDFDFEGIEIKGQKTRICIFVAVLSYSHLLFSRSIPVKIKRPGSTALNPASRQKITQSPETK